MKITMRERLCLYLGSVAAGVYAAALIVLVIAWSR